MVANRTQQQTLAIAHQAFEYFIQGLEVGDWTFFQAMLTDDFTFWFPTGHFQGLNHGKDRAAEFFEYVNRLYPEGLKVELERVTSNETTVVFEFRDQGKMLTQADLYKNRVALSLDVRGEKICAYREYFGSDGKSF